MNTEESNKQEPFEWVKQEQIILTITSRLLSYPPNSMVELVNDIKSCMEEDMNCSPEKHELKYACEQLFRYSSKELQELYVSTFDLRSKSGLYLTSHEFGDSPKRGAALIKLQKTINQAGYERVDGELADYIPMLLEFMAVAPIHTDPVRLYKRLAIVMHRILHHMEKDNPYVDIIHVLTTHVFPKPTKKEIADLENNQEEADLEELPFPIMYQ